MEERDPEDTSTRMEIQIMPVFMIWKSQLELINLFILFVLFYYVIYLFYLFKKISSTNMEIMTKVIAKEGEMPSGVVLFTICKHSLRVVYRVYYYYYYYIFKSWST